MKSPKVDRIPPKENYRPPPPPSSQSTHFDGSESGDPLELGQEKRGKKASGPKSNSGTDSGGGQERQLRLDKLEGDNSFDEWEEDSEEGGGGEKPARAPPPPPKMMEKERKSKTTPTPAHRDQV